LTHAIGQSNERMLKFRQNRIKVLKEFAGPLYGSGVDDGKDRPFATLYSFITVLLPSIATGKIAVDCNTRDPVLRQPGREIALAIERVIEDARLVDEMLGVCMDAVCGFGILKVGLEALPRGRADYADWRQDPGLPFGERISPDSYILGPCKEREAAPFEGDVYRIDREDAYNVPDVNKEALDRLATFQDTKREGAETMTPGGRDFEDLFPQFEWADIWLPKERVVVTVSPRPENGAGIIREVDGSDFTEGGPYEILGYDYVPDNPLPLGCGLQMHDLHLFLNRMGRKYMRRIDNLKDVLVVTDPEMGKVRDVSDGQIFTVTDPKSGQVFSFGGNVAEIGNAIQFMQDQQNRNGPNPELLGGLAANSKTLGQDQMKYATASQRISRMVVTTVLFMTRIIRHFGWYMWNDQARVFPGVERVGEEMIQRQSRPQDRNPQAWSDLGLSLNAYVSAAASPDQEYDRYAEMFERFIVPGIPLMASQGNVPNMQAIVSKLAEKRGLREIDDWFTMGQPAAVPGNAQGGGPRTSVNISQPGVARQKAEPATVAQQGAQ
jgi:hypothetical protein